MGRLCSQVQQSGPSRFRLIRIGVFTDKLVQQLLGRRFVAQGEERESLLQERARHLVALRVVNDHLVVLENGLVVPFLQVIGFPNPVLGVVGEP